MTQLTRPQWIRIWTCELYCAETRRIGTSSQAHAAKLLQTTAMNLPDPINAFLILLTATLASAAQADIYKCTDEHGNVAYLQTPCPVEEDEQPPTTDDDDVPVTKAELDEETLKSAAEPQSTEAQVATSRQPGEPVADCKKRFRDQIDEIDAEMRTGFSPEQGPEYKERLLALTRQLRACE